jgi:hypothetical protein
MAPETLSITDDELQVQVRTAVLAEREACRKIASRMVTFAPYMDGDYPFRNGARHAAAMIVKEILERA